MNILTQNDLFLQSATDINVICQPLRKLNITYFTYLKNFYDGSQVYLSNSAQWIDDYYNLKLYKSSLFEANPAAYHSGRFIWPKENNSPVFLHGRDVFDSSNGVTIINKNSNNCEFYFFSGPVAATWLTEFYLNNMDLLEKFIIYFKETATGIVKKADKNRLILPRNDHKNISTDLMCNNSIELRNTFLKAINNKPTEMALLSNREADIAMQLLKGKTAQEIGETLIISKRTVERHIENIKNKWSCKNKAELIKLLLQTQNFNFSNVVTE